MLKDIIFEDWKRLYDGKPSLFRIFFLNILDARFSVVFLYRIEKWFYEKNYRLLARLLHRFNMILHSCDISPKANIGPGFLIPHVFGIVIGHGVTAGKNLTLFQNVTIGAKTRLENSKIVYDYPFLKDNVTIYPNVLLYGNIEVGNNVIILGNSMVNFSVKDNCIVAGAPAKIIKTNDNEIK